MHCVENKFRRATDSMISSGNRILVAVSGGPDSVALLHLLNKLKLQSSSIFLAIAHLNHLARGEDSNKDEEFVVTLGKTMNLQTFVEKIDIILLGKTMKTSFQESARIIRYDFMQRVLKSWGGDLIALGHNADDHAETVLINLLRGTGSLGLTGIKAERGNFIRPLRDCFRNEIEDYISVHGLEYCSDKTNCENKYLRNKIRLELIPSLELYNPQIKSSLTLTSKLLTDDEDYLENEVEKILPQVGFTSKQNDFASLSLDLLKSQHPALQKRLVRHAILITKGDLRAISARHIFGILQMIECEEGEKEAHLPGDLIAVCSSGTLFFCKSHHRIKSINEIVTDSFLSRDLNIPGFTEVGFHGLCFNTKLVSRGDVSEFSISSNQAYLDYEKTGPNIEMRFFRPGDRFVPLGMKGSKKLKSFFIDEKVPRWQRSSIPLLTSKKGDIIWVYEKRIGENYRVTDKTCNILMVEGVSNQTLTTE